MAYRSGRGSYSRSSARRPARRAPARSSRSYGGKRSGAKSVRGGGQQTIKLVIQSAPAPAPAAAGVETPQVQQLLGRAKF